MVGIACLRAGVKLVAIAATWRLKQYPTDGSSPHPGVVLLRALSDLSPVIDRASVTATYRCVCEVLGVRPPPDLQRGMSDAEAVAAGYTGPWPDVMFQHVCDVCDDMRASGRESPLLMSAAVDAIFCEHVAAVLQPALSLVSEFGNAEEAVDDWFTLTEFSLSNWEEIGPNRRTFVFVRASLLLHFILCC